MSVSRLLARRGWSSAVCASKLGLLAVVFTEHLSYWTVDGEDYLDDARRLIGPDRTILTPVLDVDRTSKSGGGSCTNIPATSWTVAAAGGLISYKTDGSTTG